MALCKDPSLTYLNGLGYNVVRLPRVGIEPLDILGKDDKSVERLGQINQMWTSPEAVPTINGPQAATAVSGQKTSELKVSIGLKILAAALGAMGAAVPEVSFGYSKARKVTFMFTDVQVYLVDPLAVGKYLAAGDLSSANPFVRRYFEDDDTTAFILTEVLRSKSITVTALDDNNAEVGVDFPAIQQIVGAKVNVTSKSATNTTLTYSGSFELSFGFRCFGIAYVDGAWRVHSAKPSPAISFAAPGSASKEGALLGEGRVVIR
jgi:hypothetical protein